MKKVKFASTVSAVALIAASASAGTVYIPEGSANSILAVDSESGQIIRRIVGVEAVHGLSGQPGTPYIVAGSYTEIEREDAASVPKPDAVAADDHQAHHATPEDAAMPQNIGFSLLTVLDANNGEIYRRIEVPGAVHHTAVSPDGKLAVATHPAGDGISIVDLETMTYRSFIPTGSLPNYATFSPDGNLLYVTNGGNGTVSVVDVNEGYVSRNMRVGEAPEHFSITARGELAFVADSDTGIVYRVDLANGGVMDSFDIGGEIHGIGLSDQEDTLFVTGKENDQLISIDLSTGEQRLSPLSPAPYHLTVVPDTGKIFVSSRLEPKVWIVDQSSRQTIAEIEINGEGHQMVALP